MNDRTPHPVGDLDTAKENRRLVCDARGYCGPFLNLEFYAAFPDPLWHGMGECLLCRNTAHAASEEAKRRRARDAAMREAA